MLSRRDKLLIRPWQQKRFENHRRKVSSALPAIDDKPPISYKHVAQKPKKQQLERERITKIEKDNLILLRKLNHIKKTCRIDHYWTIPPPDFLNREAIYDSIKYQILDEDIIEIRTSNGPIKKSRCSACCPQYQPPKAIIPEERVPWAPIKPPVARQRSQSVPLPELSSSTVSNKDKQNVRKNTKEKFLKEKKSVSSAGNRINTRKGYKDVCQSLTLNRGNFKLVVNFPSDTSVSLNDTLKEKVLFGKLCSCKSMMN